MSHSYVKIWIHAIWAIKSRLPLITPNLETSLYKQIKKELSEFGCPAQIINGMPDHVHCLFLMNTQKLISEIIKQVKGGTSHWVNQKTNMFNKFEWQTGYAAYSVSESQLKKVFDYIKNQKQHHAIKSFDIEYEKLIALHGLHTFDEK